MNYSLTLWSLSIPHTHTHTPHSFSIMFYCYYVLLCTADDSRSTTYKNKNRHIHKTKITTSSIAKDIHRNSTYDHNHTTAIASLLPLSTGLSGHSGDDPVSIDVNLRSPFERHARWCVDTGCDIVIQSHSHGDAPADISPW